MAKQFNYLPDGDPSEDIAVNKLENALRAGWNMLQIATDFREQGHIAEAQSAEKCRQMAYRAAVQLLPNVEDATEHSILATALDQLAALLKPYN